MTDNTLSDEDKALFREYAKHITPLKTTPKIKEPKVQTRASLHRPPLPPPRQNDYFLSDYLSETVESNSLLAYKHTSLPPKRFSDLKNGRIAWEKKLDLHGLYANPAKEALCQFITEAMHRQQRCVLIIHGKGGQQGTPPVIKNLVNRWLPQINEVLAFYSALPKDGGSGAVYVLLKKQL